MEPLNEPMETAVNACVLGRVRGLGEGTLIKITIKTKKVEII